MARTGVCCGRAGRVSCRIARTNVFQQGKAYSIHEFVCVGDPILSEEGTAIRAARWQGWCKLGLRAFGNTISKLTLPAEADNFQCND